MNKPTSTTESLGEDIDHFTTRDQTTITGLVPDKKDDVSVVNVDSNLNTILSAISLTVSLVFVMVVIVLVVLFYAHKRELKELKSARVELTKTGEFTRHTNPTRTFNTYTSEEKDDLM